MAKGRHHEKAERKPPAMRLADLGPQNVERCFLCPSMFDTRTGTKFRSWHVCPSCTLSLRKGEVKPVREHARAFHD